MHKSYLRITLILAAIALITSCAKTPEKILSPSIKAEVVQVSEKSFVIYFTGGLKNENDSTAFVNVEGTALIISDTGEKLLTIPFRIPAILPFETGVIKEKIDVRGETAEKIMNMFSVSVEKLGTPDEPGNRFIEDKNIKLVSLKFDTKNIVRLLKEKVK